jgi:hypothetical protein
MKARKRFFFEKKRQKTFVSRGRRHELGNNQRRGCFATLPSYPFPNRKKPATPKGRRAKFREETPITRQDEEPTFIPEIIMHRTKRSVQKKTALIGIFLGHIDIFCLLSNLNDESLCRRLIVFYSNSNS